MKQGDEKRFTRDDPSEALSIRLAGFCLNYYSEIRFCENKSIIDAETFARNFFIFCHWLSSPNPYPQGWPLDGRNHTT